MVRNFEEHDLPSMMNIWLETNIKAHDFIPKEFWKDNYEMVKEILPKAEVYVYVDDITESICGFIGLIDNHIAGLFVAEIYQSKGIGQCLINFIKRKKTEISLSVYTKNIRAIRFYQREGFSIQSESIDTNTNEKENTMVWKI